MCQIATSSTCVAVGLLMVYTQLECERLSKNSCSGTPSSVGRFESRLDRPPGCYVDGGTLVLNDRTDSPAECSGAYECICCDPVQAKNNGEVCETQSPTVSPTSPTNNPSVPPTRHPSAPPTVSPSLAPTTPTMSPVQSPSTPPTAAPSKTPTGRPSLSPSAAPTRTPSRGPTLPPTATPSRRPSPPPTSEPSSPPSATPTRAPSLPPTTQPSRSPQRPSVAPSRAPSEPPTAAPSLTPSATPSLRPTSLPSTPPSLPPSRRPSSSPSVPPTRHPTSGPTVSPTVAPTHGPTPPPPTVGPSAAPSPQPTTPPSRRPTRSPTVPPTAAPSAGPTARPTGPPSLPPTKQPSLPPSREPSVAPTTPPTTPAPSVSPSRAPTATPTATPTGAPSAGPSQTPTGAPSTPPTLAPTTLPPTAPPSAPPSASPSLRPSSTPTAAPSAPPSGQPTAGPSTQPSRAPSRSPTASPRPLPTKSPSARPSKPPSPVPTAGPSPEPSVRPSTRPSWAPSATPTAAPSTLPPTSAPSTTEPSIAPSTPPTGHPAQAPTAAPTPAPSSTPSSAPLEFNTATVQAVEVTSDVVAGVSMVTGVSSAARMTIAVAGCTAPEPRELPRLLHPTGLRVESKLPHYSGAVVGNLIVAAGFAGFHFSVSAVVQLLTKSPMLEAQGKVRFPHITIIICVWLSQGTLYAAGMLLNVGSDGVGTALALVGLVAGFSIPLCLLRQGRLSREDAGYKRDPKSGDGCVDKATGPGEWLSVRHSQVERWGVAFRTMRPDHHGFIAVELLASDCSVFAAGILYGGCASCSAARAIDTLVSLLMVGLILARRPHCRPAHAPFSLLSQLAFAVAGVVLMSGLLSGECPSEVPGQVLAQYLLISSGMCTMVVPIVTCTGVSFAFLKQRRVRLQADLDGLARQFDRRKLSKESLQLALEEGKDGHLSDVEFQEAWTKAQLAGGLRYGEGITLRQFLAQEPFFWKVPLTKRKQMSVITLEDELPPSVASPLLSDSEIPQSRQPTLLPDETWVTAREVPAYAPNSSMRSESMLTANASYRLQSPSSSRWRDPDRSRRIRRTFQSLHTSASYGEMADLGRSSEDRPRDSDMPRRRARVSPRNPVISGPRDSVSSMRASRGASDALRNTLVTLPPSRSETFDWATMAKAPRRSSTMASFRTGTAKVPPENRRATAARGTITSTQV